LFRALTLGFAKYRTRQPNVVIVGAGLAAESIAKYSKRCRIRFILVPATRAFGIGGRTDGRKAMFK
jgi:hypothetical protein